MKLSDYQHILWDWNGTIVDDAHLCIESLNILLAQRNLQQVPLREYQEHFKFPVRDFYRQRGFDFDRESYDQVAEDFISHYHHHRFECQLHSGIVELFHYFSALNIPQSILSAYRQDSLVEAVEHYGLSPFFDQINGLDNNHAGSKKNLGLQRLGQLDLDPQQVLYIGDTDHDAEVAEAMGVTSLLLEGGHQSRARLEATGVTVFATPQELLKNCG